MSYKTNKELGKNINSKGIDDDNKQILTAINEGHEIVLYDPDAVEIMKRLGSDFEMKIHKIEGREGDKLGKICLLKVRQQL